MTSYGSMCDDFAVAVYLNTKMELPGRRESVLHFFESLQKSFPKMTDFDRRENGDYALEEERDSGNYRWVTMELRRLGMGYLNPPSLDDVDATAERVLETAPFHLDLSPLDAESLDVMFTFDFMYAGNHDEVVAEALAAGTPLENMIQLPASKVINYEPSLMLALDETCRLQCRLSVETAHQRLPNPHWAIPRCPDQRLLHGAPVLGQAAVQELLGLIPESTADCPGVGR